MMRNALYRIEGGRAVCLISEPMKHPPENPIHEIEGNLPEGTVVMAEVFYPIIRKDDYDVEQPDAARLRTRREQIFKREKISDAIEYASKETGNVVILIPEPILA